jgi:hypothetical protein
MSEEIEVDEFTPEESEDFRNLLVVGRLAETVSILGHDITIRTLSVEEDLAVGLIIKPYLGSNSYERAYKTAIVAACVRDIDGEPFGQALNSDQDAYEVLQFKFKKINKYYPIFLDEVYERFKKLENKLLPTVSRLGKISN